MGWGPSYDGVTVKNNFVEIKGKRSFDARSNIMMVFTLVHKLMKHFTSHLVFILSLPWEEGQAKSLKLGQTKWAIG